jgi:hypothetical protein
MLKVSPCFYSLSIPDYLGVSLSKQKLGDRSHFQIFMSKRFLIFFDTTDVNFLIYTTD